MFQKITTLWNMAVRIMLNPNTTHRHLLRLLLNQPRINLLISYIEIMLYNSLRSSINVIGNVCFDDVLVMLILLLVLKYFVLF